MFLKFFQRVPDVRVAPSAFARQWIRATFRYFFDGLLESVFNDLDNVFGELFYFGEIIIGHSRYPSGARHGACSDVRCFLPSAAHKFPTGMNAPLESSAPS